MATLVKTPSGKWKAIIRRAGWPMTVKTFRTKRDAGDWARRTEDDMVRGAFIQRAPGDRMTVAVAMKRYLSDVVPYKAAHNTGGRPEAFQDSCETSWEVFPDRSDA